MVKLIFKPVFNHGFMTTLARTALNGRNPKLRIIPVLVGMVTRESIVRFVIYHRYADVVLLGKGVLQISSNQLVPSTTLRFPPRLVPTRIQEIFGCRLRRTRLRYNVVLRVTTIVPVASVRQVSIRSVVVQSVVDRSFVHEVGILVSIEALHDFRDLRKTEVSREFNFGSSRFTFFRCNQDNTVGSTRTVDSRCRSIFKNIDRLDIVGVNQRQRIGSGVVVFVAPLVGALPTSKGIPSTIYNGCELVENEFAPRMVMLIPEPGAPSLELTFLPTNFPFQQGLAETCRITDH